MFSRLEAIFKSNFIPIREGEANPDLSRNDKNKDRKSLRNKEKDQNKDRDDHSEFDDDMTTVSVLALENFLNDLSHAPDIKHDFSDRKDVPEKPKTLNITKEDPNENKARANTARAIEAYRHMADESNTPPPPQKIEGRIDRMLYHLSDDEKKMVATLLTELHTLREQGVLRLSIHNDTSFFNGIIEAIKHEKTPQD